MVKLRLFLIFLFLVIFSCSDDNIVNLSSPTFTEIQGQLSSDLKYLDSPFHVIGTITVEMYDAISIEPGVELYFADSCMFLIKGRLMAQGDSSRPIVFTSMTNTWKGIKVLDSKNSSTFKHVVVQNASVVDGDSTDYGVFEVRNSTINITNSIFRKNSSLQGGGLALLNSRATISNNIFRDNQATAYGGAIFCYISESIIKNNTFFKNHSINHGGGLVLFNSKNDSVQNNIFFQNTGMYGDPRISVVASDSSNYYLKYNFLSMDSPDPNFISDMDLRLSEFSVCKNNGNPLTRYNDFDGSRNDQGAYGGPLGNWYFTVEE